MHEITIVLYNPSWPDAKGIGRAPGVAPRELYWGCYLCRAAPAEAGAVF